MATSKSKKATTSVTLVATDSEITAQIEAMKNSIPQLIAEQKEYLKSLQGDDEDTAVSLDIEYNGESIKSVEKVSTLVEMEASIIAREAAYTAVLRKRDLEDKVVEWSLSGKNLAHWGKVLDKAFKKLVNKAKIELVKSRISELEVHLSEDAKMKATLEKLIKEGTTKLA